MEVVWSELAIESLANVYQYVEALFGGQEAENVAADIVHFVDSLGQMPRIGTLQRELSVKGEMRRAVHKQNNIYYHISDDRLKIIVVWDARQNAARLKKLIKLYWKRL